MNAHILVWIEFALCVALIGAATPVGAPDIAVWNILGARPMNLAMIVVLELIAPGRLTAHCAATLQRSQAGWKVSTGVMNGCGKFPASAVLRYSARLVPDVFVS